MDGHVNGHSDAAGRPFQSPQSLDHVVEALDVVYAPRSTNDARRQATIFLDEWKSHPDSLSRGIALASDPSKSAPVRLYGLSVLEYKIRYEWQTITADPSVTAKDWVVGLAQGVTGEEPSYLRNKIAQLWVEVAERCWGTTWIDMDQELCKLWQCAYCQQEIVLHVLETLSDEVFSKESSTAGVRGAELAKALVEIFTPELILSETYPGRDSAGHLRTGSEGWIERLLSLGRQCLQNDISSRSDVRACTLKILANIRSFMPWMLLKALSATNCIDFVCLALRVSDTAIQMAAIEALHALYHRSNIQDEWIVPLVRPLLTVEGISMLEKLYDGSQVNLDDLDEGKYSLLKKTTEVLCALGTFLEQRPHLILNQHHSHDSPAPAPCDLSQILQFFVKVFGSPSLVISVPIAYLWTKLLASREIFRSDALPPLIGSLLETCNQRLLRYEALPAECEDATFLFLNEDFDTMPERHAFVGNYRRYCTEIIERIVGKSPFEAVRHILGQASRAMQPVIASAITTNNALPSDSLILLRMDAHFTVLMSALKAYMKISKSPDSRTPEKRNEHLSLQTDIETWCKDLLQQNLEDPTVRKRILQLVVEVAINTQSSSSSVCLSIFESIFLKPYTSLTGSDLHQEAVKEYMAVCPRELQKLAFRFSDRFDAVYSDLSSSVTEMCENSLVDSRTAAEYRAFLFTVTLRASATSQDSFSLKAKRLNEMMQPTVDLWNSPDFDRFTSDFGSFCTILGLDQYPNYFLSRKAQNIEDWSSLPLDEEGLQLRERIQYQSDNLPLQALRCFLSASTDKISLHSSQYELARTCWHDKIPWMLPKLLRLAGHAHAFHNPQTWSSYPSDMQNILQRTLIDRVWQSGISSESREDFFIRVRKSKGTLEGLASTVRAAVRGVREISYWILHCASYFEESFYGHADLPEPLARAMFADAHCLSTHHISALLKLSQALIDSCPVQLQSQFLPPLLINVFKQLDAKITMEWETIERKSRVATNEDDLDREMKAESVLRQLTHSAVLLVSHLLQPPPVSSHHSAQPAPSHGSLAPRADGVPNGTRGNGNGATNTMSPSQNLRSLICSSPAILEQIVLYCTHQIRQHDSRSCATITRVLRNIIPEFQPRRPSNPRAEDTAGDGMSEAFPEEERTTEDEAKWEVTASQVREFFATEILQACILSLHDPYFSEQQMQKDLAALIAAIIALYSPATSTPRSILLSLPGMTEAKVDEHIAQICKPGIAERVQRSWALTLLESVRGVSVAESGKMNRSLGVSGDAMSASTMTPKRAKRGSLIQHQQGYAGQTTPNGMDASMGGSGGGNAPGDGDEFGGLADLFG